MDKATSLVKLSEKAEEWGISVRRIQALCAEGKVSGAVRMGRDWMIPIDAVRPIDGRTKAGRAATDDAYVNMPFPKKTPFLHMTSLYNRSGGAEECIKALESNPLAQKLFAAEIAYSRGQVDDVYASATYLLEKHTDFYSTLSSGMLLALCAIWRGDLTMWRRAKLHMAEAPAVDDSERDIIAFSITAIDSMLYDATAFPEWFKAGCFEPLHKD